MAGLLGDIGDWFTGGGDYADPSKIDPRYGVPYSDVRQAGINTLANVSAILLAAGQGGIDPSQRAQLLSQLGPAMGGMNTDLYNASQRRLMQAQTQEKMREIDENKRLDDMINDPNKLQALGLNQAQVQMLGRTGLRQVLANRLSQNPLQDKLLQAQIDQAQATLGPDWNIQKTEDGALYAVNKKDPSQYKVIAAGTPERPLTPEERKAYNIPDNVPAKWTKNGPTVMSSGTTVNVGAKAGAVAADELIKGTIADVDAGRQAVSNINQSNMIRAMLDEGVITGFGAEGRAMLGNAAQTLGFRADDPRVANTYVVMTQLAGRVLSSADKLKGAMSDKDIVFLKQAAGGNVALPESAIRRILDLSDMLDRGAIETGRAAADDIRQIPSIQEAGMDKSNRLRINDPKPMTKTFSVDGKNIQGRLNIDGKYYYVDENGKRFIIQE